MSISCGKTLPARLLLYRSNTFFAQSYHRVGKQVVPLAAWPSPDGNASKSSGRACASPPGGRARENRKFIQAPSPEIWRKTISGGEEVLAGKWGGLFLGYLLGKNYRRRDRDRLVPPRWMDAAVYRTEVCYPFGRKHGKASGSETARLHHARWRRGGGVAARGKGAAFGEAADYRVFGRGYRFGHEPMDRRFCPAAARTRLG